MKGWQINSPMHEFLLTSLWQVTFRHDFIKCYDSCHGHRYFISLFILIICKLMENLRVIKGKKIIKSEKNGA